MFAGRLDTQAERHKFEQFHNNLRNIRKINYILKSQSGFADVDISMDIITFTISI